VAFGELISTTIISEYLACAGIPNRWIDMRRALVTEQRHKDAEVDLRASAPLLRAEVEGREERIFVGQGFIGGAPDGTTTTLGREGSDYSAAVVAHILDAESMAVWKDVDGVLNADPKIFPDAVQIAELNYLDTIELAYSGAQIIHPRTIKPLQNKNIPLYVRPFGDKRKPGTVIRGVSAPVEVPILILKKDQVLLTIRSRDFSFVLEEKFAAIFSLLERFRIKANLIHNSAVNLSLCVDDSWHIDQAVDALRREGFDVMKIGSMELLTVRGYTDELWQRYACGPQVFIRQATQSTVRIVRKEVKGEK
ncbi:MAG: aspartate kinase, partial [Alistipes sp.]|nr:aspartate kinase [Alistipes sp.]